MATGKVSISDEIARQIAIIFKLPDSWLVSNNVGLLLSAKDDYSLVSCLIIKNKEAKLGLIKFINETN